MIAGTAQRKRQVEAGHTRQGGFKQAGVFRCELAIQERRAPVRILRRPNPQRGLQTGQTPALIGGEAGGGLAELQRIRGVFCVIDGQEVAGGLAEGEIQGAGLGPGCAGRADKDVEPGRTGRGAGGGEGRLVMRFQHQKSLKPVGRVVDLRQPIDQLADNRGFVMKRCQDGVARPPLRRPGLRGRLRA